MACRFTPRSASLLTKTSTRARYTSRWIDCETKACFPRAFLIQPPSAAENRSAFTVWKLLAYGRCRNPWKPHNEFARLSDNGGNGNQDGQNRSASILGGCRGKAHSRPAPRVDIGGLVRVLCISPRIHPESGARHTGHRCGRGAPHFQSCVRHGRGVPLIHFICRSPAFTVAGRYRSGHRGIDSARGLFGSCAAFPTGGGDTR